MSRVWRFAVGCIGLACVLVTSPVRAVGEVSTELTLRPVEPATIGSVVHVIADLRLATGEPLAGEAIELTIDGEHVRRIRTEADGSADFRLPQDMRPGSYTLHASYGGQTDELAPASADLVLVVSPFQLEVETVPPLPGMVFTLNDERFEADAEGIARIGVDVPGQYSLAVLDTEYRGDDQRAEFSRWNTELFGPVITIDVPVARSLQAGFDIYRPASQVFVDPDGGTVDPGRITSITLRSSLGNVLVFPDGEERDYKASRSVRRPNGLESVAVRYNVEAVEVDGSNVVNAGQQRFLVEADGPWEISLLLYSAHMEPHDALFGFTAGDNVEVTYPNGKVERVEADENGDLTVHWLARGIYRMTVADPPGWAPAVPVALSRDQEVELRVITYLDMAVAVLAGASVAFGLLHFGRPHLIPNVIGGARRRLRLPQPSVLRRRVAMSQIEPIGDQSEWLTRRLNLRAQPAQRGIEAIRAVEPVRAESPGDEAITVAAERAPRDRDRLGRFVAKSVSSERTSAGDHRDAVDAATEARSTKRRTAQRVATSPETPVESAASARKERSSHRGTAGSDKVDRPARAAASRPARQPKATTERRPRQPKATTERRPRQPKATTERRPRQPKATTTRARRAPTMSEPPADPAAARRSQLEVLGLSEHDVPPIELAAPRAALAGTTVGVPVSGIGAHDATPDITGTTRLQMCPHCGFSLSTGARFCRRCGHALGARSGDPPMSAGMAGSPENGSAGVGATSDPRMVEGEPDGASADSGRDTASRRGAA